MTRTPRPIVHRPLLDGTRGVMMWIVLGYHLGGVTRLSGAWVSMDFFFVLSGYLITTLLVREYEHAGGIDLRRFYRRRVRRLGPAILVVLAGLFLAVYLLGEDRFPDLRGDGLATLFYVANWRFIFSSQDYFASFDPAAVTHASPLLHTWSLAIEEQFYIFWPLLFWVIAKLTRFDRRRMMVTLGVVAVVSALWTRHLTVGDGDLFRAYYGTDTRGQCLMVGALLALLLWHDRWDDDRSRRVGSWLGTAALVGLVTMMFTFTEQSRAVYANGGFLLIAVVSAVFIFGCARAERGPLVWIFGNRLSRHLGLISYCFYLWHWPVIVLVDSRHLDLGWLELSLIKVAISLALAELTYWLLERPVHRQHWKIERMGWTFGGGFVAVAAVLLITTHGVTSADPAVGSHSSGAESGSEVLVLGDSLAWLLSGTAPETYPHRVDGVFRAHCDIIGDRIHTGDGTEDADPECGSWPGAWADGLAEYDPDAVLVTLGIRQLFDPDVDGERIRLGTDRWIEEYEAAVRRAATVIRDGTDAPVFWLDVACFEWAEVSVEGEEHEADRLDLVNDELRRILAGFDDVTVVPYRDRVCGGPDRDVVDFDLRPDGAHLTVPAAEEFWWWLEPDLDAAFDAGS